MKPSSRTRIFVGASQITTPELVLLQIISTQELVELLKNPSVIARTSSTKSSVCSSSSSPPFTCYGLSTIKFSVSVVTTFQE